MSYQEAAEWALSRTCAHWRENASCGHAACKKAADVAAFLYAEAFAHLTPSAEVVSAILEEAA